MSCNPGKSYKTLCLALAACLFILSSHAASVDTVLIYSNSMHKNVKCVVIKPAAYEDEKQRFAVLYLLHGWSGDYSNWVLKVPALLQEVDENGCMVVCPDGAYNSWYFDSPIDTNIRYETNVALEIPAYIDAHYRTIADRKARAITGLSMGGHGALYLAIRHEDVFGAAGSMSGGVDFRPFPNNWDIKTVLGDYSTHAEDWNKNVVVDLVDSLHNGDLKMIIDCGVGDFFLPVNRDLHQKLLAAKIDHDYIERPGEHNWDYWSNSIKYQLLFFHDYFLEQKVLN